ncbi:MAG TPA: MurT ligase domain-containing protein [Acidimicrobiales bacterium]|nr:MurT ligase domain-containing protein [Acidimicrobiales bacterium]
MPSMRTRVAASLGRATSAASRATKRGDGSVIGARVTLLLAPHALDELAAGWRIATVSGTNGKSTTTAFLTAACTAGGRSVVSNTEGANLRSGVVALLSSRRTRDADLAVLEVDELALPTLLPSFEHPVVVLLNLSRDQLDRFGEVRTVASRWRAALAMNPATVIANADDPLVTWGASAAENVTFVGVGLGWRLDAVSCPACGERIECSDTDWWCSACSLRRPSGHQLSGDELLDPAGKVLTVLRPGVPGRHNLANAALAVVAAMKLGVEPSVAAGATEAVTSIAGRYQTVAIGRSQVRLLLAKNPAGWHELLTMIDGESRPVLLAINARTADGRDPSWLWDVEFERLRGRKVVAAGERAADLAVRLHYAEVDCEVWHGDVIERLRTLDDPLVDVLANYTVFADLTRQLRMSA